MAWNAIIQLPVDPDHVFQYGLVKMVLDLCMASLGGARALQKRLELDRRLVAFNYPIGWERFTFHMLRTTGSRHSMELFRRAGTVCIFIFQGLSLFISVSCLSGSIQMIHWTIWIDPWTIWIDPWTIGVIQI